MHDTLCKIRISIPVLKDLDKIVKMDVLDSKQGNIIRLICKNKHSIQMKLVRKKGHMNKKQHPNRDEVQTNEQSPDAPARARLTRAVDVSWAVALS